MLDLCLENRFYIIRNKTSMLVLYGYTLCLKFLMFPTLLIPELLNTNVFKLKKICKAAVS